MHCNLIELPVELLLAIIKELRRDEHIRVRTNDKKWKVYGADIPEKPDKSVKIYHDLIHWSCTCSYFRNLLAPDIFKTVKLVNDEKSGSSLNIVAKSQHNVHVKELYFIGSALCNPRSKAAFSDTEGILPYSVYGLICELQRFPSLERLSLKFDFKFSIRKFSIFKEETPEQVLKAEASVAWRALMSKTYSALAQNKSPRFKHLEIRNLLSKNVSTYDHASFHEFLSHFEQFTVSICGKDKFMRYLLGRTGLSPPGKFDEYFFNHLANVTTLSIKNLESEPFGLARRFHTPIALKVDQMRLLTNLHLDHIFASPELSDFLVGHKDTLEELTLHDCYASTGARSSIEHGIYWSQLFTSIFSACPAKLRRLELDSGVWSRFFTGFLCVDEERDNVLTILQQNPNRILFPYAKSSEDYGLLTYDRDECFAAFWNEEDQRSWDRLMGLVEANSKEATTK